MTLEKNNNSHSFERLMSSLNINEEFPSYKLDEELNYHQLSLIKKQIELQLNTLFDLLQNQFKTDMDTPLTIDGFPRSDIDVVSVRLIRVEIIRLRNDHKYLLSLIETSLINKFKHTSDNTHDITNNNSFKEIDSAIPFAIIDEVIIDSPAHKAGLQKADKIVVFDKDIHAGNHNKLINLVSRVGAKVDQTIQIKVLRDSPVTLELKPTNNWGGRGLLGCKILPI